MINLTKQEAFDKVLAHLRKQGKAAVSVEGDCVYRAPDGCMCAAGCLIPDNLYSPEFEGTCVSGLGIFATHSLSDFLDRLQEAHDEDLRLYGTEVWEDKMESIADEFNLTYTPPTTAHTY